MSRSNFGSQANRSSRWWALIAVVLVALAGPPAATGQEAPSSYAIRGARLVTVSGATIAAGTIVIADGIIQAVGVDVDVPAGAWEIDGEGLTVYPGLINALSTAGMPSDATIPSGGGGAGRGGPPSAASGPQRPFSRGPEDRPATYTWRAAAVVLEGTADDFVAWRNAGFTTVVMAPSRGFFAGHAAVVNLAGARSRDMVVKTDVAQRVNLSGGPGHQGYPGSLAGSFAYVKQLFSDTAHYVRANAAYDADPRGKARPSYDRALEGLLTVQSGAEPMLFPGSTAAEIGRALSTAATVGASVIVYGGQEAYRATSELASACRCSSTSTGQRRPRTPTPRRIRPSASFASGC